MTTPRSKPNMTRENTFDPRKGYRDARIQQGVPLFDVDINDGFDAVGHQAQSAAMVGRGDAGIARAGNTLALVPLNAETPLALENLDNFGFVPGRVATRYGVVDMDALIDTTDKEELRRVFALDHRAAANAGVTNLVPYANALFRGFATSSTTGSGGEVSLVDANKAFSAAHRLVEVVTTVPIEDGPMELDDSEFLPSVPLGSAATSMKFTEPGCRVIFLTGSYAGKVLPVSAFTATSLTLSTTDEDTIEVGDEYVVVPSTNLALYSYRIGVDSRNSDATPLASGVIGDNGRIPWLVVYLHSFLDAISSSEDEDLVHPALTGTDVAARTRIGWAVRVAQVEFNGIPRASALAGLLDSIGASRVDTSGLTTEDFLASGAMRTDVGLYARTAQNLVVLPKMRATGRAIFDAAISQIEDAANSVLIGSDLREGESDSRVLYVLAPRPVEDVAAKLNGYFYPSFTTEEETPDGRGSRCLYGNGSWFWAHPAVATDTGALLSELNAARGLLRLRNYAQVGGTNTTGYGHGSPSGLQPSSFRSFDEHIAFLDHMVLSLSGLGGIYGAESSLVRADSRLVTASGQAANVFYVEDEEFDFDVNLSAAFAGTVHMIDPISPSSSVPSVRRYTTPDGDEIEQGDADDWTVIKSASEVVTDHGTSNPADMLAAIALRESLNFRKLAIKTSAFREADLFNYSTIPIPSDPLIRPSQRDGEDYRTDVTLTERDAFVGRTASAFPWRFASAYGHSNAQSYSIGSLLILPTEVTSESGDNSVWAYARLVAGNVYAAYGTRFVGTTIDPLPTFYPEPWFVENAGVRIGKSSLPTEPGMFGPMDTWGRLGRTGSVLGDRPTDALNNRCTTMRLRYHIGDYYPAPNGENALVDTLNLFVRVEPLSEVHWATMPKHQHSVLADSMHIYASLERMLEFFNDQPFEFASADFRTPRHVAGYSVLPTSDDLPPTSFFVSADDVGPPATLSETMPIVHTSWPAIEIPEGTATWASRFDMIGRTGSMPDVDTDTAFVGAGSAGGAHRGPREFAIRGFTDPTMLGGRWNITTGRQVPLHKRIEADNFTEYADGFQKAALETMNLWEFNEDERPRLLPLMGLMSALYNSSLQQKLLWNCSFRVLHARPGGGARGVSDTFMTHSTAPKSLTELFVTRNRSTGEAVPLPHAPDSMDRKVFLHLGSMHPASAASTARMRAGAPVATTAHPNRALLGHLYPMVQDSLGADFTVSADKLNATALMGITDNRLTTSAFGDPTGSMIPDALTGDAYAADPFDAALERANEEADFQTALSDRLHQNCGIEIDLVNELRYVRENADEHGLDQTYAGAHGEMSWLDLMPEPGDLTAPGDHEILFVLYTGKYGQKMVDDTIPDWLNPAYCGCHLVASIEVNRPSQKLPSGGAGLGKHYGREFETWHVLGHL